MRIFVFRNTVFALIMAFGILFPGAAASEDLRSVTENGITIRYPPSLKNAAEKISGAYPLMKTRVEAKIGWELEFAPSVVLLRENEEFQKITGSRIITAFAVPAQQMIVMNYARLDRQPYDLQDTFEHELYHLLLHHHIKGARIPRWLDEGIAQWASGGIADIMNERGQDILRQAVLSDRLLSFASIGSSFPGRDRELLLAYQQSRNFIEYIADRSGSDRLLLMLDAMRDGRSLEDAFQNAFAESIDSMEIAWRKSLRNRYLWTTYVADHIYLIVFLTAAAITVLAYVRFWFRLKNYRDEDDSEEPTEKNEHAV